jgi:hypothetical protein
MGSLGALPRRGPLRTNPFSEAQTKTLKYRPDFPEPLAVEQRADLVARQGAPGVAHRDGDQDRQWMVSQSGQLIATTWEVWVRGQPGVSIARMEAPTATDGDEAWIGSTALDNGPGQHASERAAGGAAQCWAQERSASCPR